MCRSLAHTTLEIRSKYRSILILAALSRKALYRTNYIPVLRSRLAFLVPDESTTWVRRMDTRTEISPPLATALRGSLCDQSPIAHSQQLQNEPLTTVADHKRSGMRSRVRHRIVAAVIQSILVLSWSFVV